MTNRFRRVSLALALLWLSIYLLFSSNVAAQQPARRSFRSSAASSRSYSSRSTPKGSSFNLSQTDQSLRYSSRSLMREKKGSLFNTRARTTTRGTGLAEAVKKADSASKFMRSVQGQQLNKTYRQIVIEYPALDHFLTPQYAENRIPRRLFFYNKHASPVNTYYTSAPTLEYNDPYDNTFFKYVTALWLFHHWDSIDQRRFDEASLRALQAEFASLEQQGVAKDPYYTLPDVDPDLQYNDEELKILQEAHDVITLEAEQTSESGGIGWLILFLVSLAVVGGVYFVTVRRY